MTDPAVPDRPGSAAPASPTAAPGASPAPSPESRRVGGGAPTSSGDDPASTGGARSGGRPESAGAPTARPGDDRTRPGSQRERQPGEDGSTTVLPGAPLGGQAAAAAGVRRPAPPRPVRPGPGRPTGRATPAVEPTRTSAKGRRAKLAIQRIDPWSVFLYSLVSSLFLGLALVVAVAALYAVLGNLGVLGTVNQLYLELAGGEAAPLLTATRFVGGAAVLAAVNVVLLTLLATLGSLLYNLCASFTGGVEVTLGNRDA